jgi:toxin secretion/phage lysis holin
MTWESMRLKAGAVLAVAGGLWGGLNPLIQTLAVLMALDFASGFLHAFGSSTVSSDASFRGMAKKAMMLVLVGAASAYNATQPLGFDAAAAVAAFFCTTEFISIVENAGRLGVPIPRPLMDALSKLNGAIGVDKKGGDDGAKSA